MYTEPITSELLTPAGFQEELTAAGLAGVDITIVFGIKTAKIIDGCPYAVMSCAGNSNHGIAVVIPPGGDGSSPGHLQRNAGKEPVRFPALNIYIRLFAGEIFATCGYGVSAATAAAATMAWLMGGTDEQIGKAIRNMSWVSTPGMVETQKTILKIMMEKDRGS